MSNLFFAPENKKHGDFCLIEKDDRIYSIFIENEKTNGAVTKGVSNGNSFGLAVSDDGLFWEYLGKVKSPGKKGTWNDKSLWAMQVFKEGDEYLMIYSAIARIDGRNHPTQQFGIARSKDLKEWADFDDNPVIKNTDTGSHYYPLTMHRFCWRDANIRKIDDKFYCILAANDLAKPHELSGCTALLKSDDLKTWTDFPPVFSPGKYREVETPHIHEINSKYYIIFGENAHSMSMRFAVSDSFLGEYVEPELNVFTPAHCYAGVMFEWKGEHYFYHWIMDRLKGKNERYLAPPKVVDIIDGNIFLKQHPRFAGFFTECGEDIIGSLRQQGKVVFRKTVDVQHCLIRIRSQDENYSRNVSITNTPHGISIRDYTTNDRFNESRTMPLRADSMDVEVFLENRFMEVYINKYLVYATVVEFDISKIEKIEVKKRFTGAYLAASLISSS
ncbi:hypothetical protein HQ545_03930 [Candidatus Woesearchaeota archaeon]|nr:hypothetical protein [Candidatus Woesearchaeota archaeon]